MRNNSIRLRLTQGEVARLNETGRVEEAVEFGAGRRFVYALEAEGEADKIHSTFEDGLVRISVPRETVAAWATSEQIGIETAQDVGNGKTLRILIEKDFACLERREGEDDSDTFPHPGTAKNP